MLPLKRLSLQPNAALPMTWMQHFFVSFFRSGKKRPSELAVDLSPVVHQLLTREKQYEKLLIYRRLFIVLFGGLFLATGILIVQLYVAALVRAVTEQVNILNPCHARY